MNYTRRELGLLLPALAAAEPAGEPFPSKTYPYGDLPATANGPNRSRPVLDARTHTGFPVELHITTLGPGQAPHPPHHHVHEEILLLRTGILDVTISGQTARVTAGSVVSVASGVEHGWKNPGSAHAEYFVFALGPKA